MLAVSGSRFGGRSHKLVTKSAESWLVLVVVSGEKQGLEKYLNPLTDEMKDYVLVAASLSEEQGRTNEPAPLRKHRVRDGSLAIGG